MHEIHFDSIDSTNTYAKQHCQEFLQGEITCISADSQTAGRGRHNHSWISPPGCNLYVTFYFTLPVDTLHLSTLAQILTYSFSSLLLEQNLNPKIKWPNDVQLSHKKLSGVLCEVTRQPSHIDIFLGIGINVNMPQDILQQIDQPATSLLVETGHPWDRQALLKKLQKRFASDLELFKTSGFAPFHHQIQALLALKGQQIRCFDGERYHTGICHSLAPDGRLNLLLSDDSIQAVSAADITAI